LNEEKNEHLKEKGTLYALSLDEHPSDKTLMALNFTRLALRQKCSSLCSKPHIRLGAAIKIFWVRPPAKAATRRTQPAISRQQCRVVLQRSAEYRPPGHLAQAME